MTLSSAQLAAEDRPLWFCLKAQPKHEHVAAASLQKMMGLPTFAPRLRFRKATTRGAVWFVEALFPGYLFAQFNYRDSHRQVQHAPGVVSIVRFGDTVAVLDAQMLDGIRSMSGKEEVIVFDPEMKVGDAVQIVEGAFRGLEAVVTQLLPGKERVKVLLEFLGRSIEAEVLSPKLLPGGSPRVGKLGIIE